MAEKFEFWFPYDNYLTEQQGSPQQGSPQQGSPQQGSPQQGLGQPNPVDMTMTLQAIFDQFNQDCYQNVSVRTCHDGFAAIAAAWARDRLINQEAHLMAEINSKPTTPWQLRSPTMQAQNSPRQSRVPRIHTSMKRPGEMRRRIDISGLLNRKLTITDEFTLA